MRMLPRPIPCLPRHPPPSPIKSWPSNCSFDCLTHRINGSSARELRQFQRLAGFDKEDIPFSEAFQRITSWTRHSAPQFECTPRRSLSVPLTDAMLSATPFRLAISAMQSSPSAWRTGPVVSGMFDEVVACSCQVPAYANYSTNLDNASFQPLNHSISGQLPFPIWDAGRWVVPTQAQTTSQHTPAICPTMSRRNMRPSSLTGHEVAVDSLSLFWHFVCGRECDLSRAQ
ncbi:hypothetical protein N657DRAFT_641216 [Parathielavia appendiculata]|uniref:Uncharacterized protein n=1 Tax=Parathielavia appendiculata TaxID=2587402 RepID=A0AAN6U7F4_9PEZI|nr:hypothetical protein N657DRAFT_641216 [Parathielavia appendiculata]